MKILIALAIGTISLAGCLHEPEGLSQRTFEGNFGPSTTSGTLHLQGAITDVPAPDGRLVPAFVVAAGEHHVYVSVDTWEPLGSFEEVRASPAFAHAIGGFGSLSRYPLFFALKVSAANLDAGDRLQYMGMQFRVEAVGSQSADLSLVVEQDESQSEFRYRVDWEGGHTRLISLGSDERLWIHGGNLPLPGPRDVTSTLYDSDPALEFGPHGTVPPSGTGGPPFTMQDVLQHLKENNEAGGTFLQRNPDAQATDAHYDADGAGSPEVPLLHRWSITLQGDGERMRVVASAFADPVGLEQHVVKVEELRVQDGGPALRASSNAVVTAGSVYAFCVSRLPPALVQVSYLSAGSGGMIIGGMPIGGLSRWGCGDPLFGLPLWDGELGQRIRSPVQD